MILNTLRGVVIVLVASVITLYVSTEFQEQTGLGFVAVVALIMGALLVAGVVIGVDVAMKDKKLSAVSGVFLGLIAGLVAAFALSFVVDLTARLVVPEVGTPPRDVSEAEYTAATPERQREIDYQRELFQAMVDRREAFLNLFEGVKVVIGLIACYVAISLVLQTKDDFRFVVPYVEFAKEIRGNRPTILDTSVIIDGRIVDLIESRVLQGSYVVPRFVLEELQQVADSADKLKRSRGRRGLDVLGKLQHGHQVEVRIEERDVEGNGVDQKLLVLAELLQARVMTNDYNLNKVAEVRGVDVVNLNDVAKAMRPIVLPGEHMTVRIVKPGESATQGVGYLDDGTMVVVEHARDQMDQEVEITVTSTLQTSAGRMIFGKFDGPGAGAGAAGSGVHRAQRSGAHTPPPSASEGPRGGQAAGGEGPQARQRASRRNPRRG
ncbi:MAG: TRAM domain-containing protein [Planctomycetota bacterium]